MAFLNLKGDGTYTKISMIQIFNNGDIFLSLKSGGNWKKLIKLDGTIVTFVPDENMENFTLRGDTLAKEGNIYDNLYNYLKTETYIKDLPFVDELGNTPTHKEREVTDPETGETHIEIVEV